MSSSPKHLVDSGFVGKPPKRWTTKIETVKVTIYDFKERKEKFDKGLGSPILKAHGYNWTIEVFPRGSVVHQTTSKHDRDSLSLRLHLHDRDDVSVTCRTTFRCKGTERTCGAKVVSKGKGIICESFLSREDALEKYLEDDGSLVIESDIQIAAEDKRVWYPNKLIRQDILVELYQNASSECSDVAFSVEGTIYLAHKNIIFLRCKKLWEIAKECNFEHDRPIQIDSVSRDIFKSILDFVYTVEMPNIKNLRMAAEVIVAADCFDCVHIKLYAESIIVDKFLSADSAAEWLVFADSQSCALLKEAAIKLFIADTKTVKSAEAWSKVKESPQLVLELLDSITNDCSEEIDRIDVGDLRKILQKANLEFDGSRAVLVESVKTLIS